ncbi:MAG TPA: UDP-2,3-diacylglucosamine diphosphatase [Afifellaceae bacterium]|nr:UDP-2,3-diacylglucosamine diphosphatase [Afifellaceae bacterium]
MNGGNEPRHFRALFISDTHLGTRGSQTGLLLDFLRAHDAETIYLVGDIVDGWRLKRNWFWPQQHNDVVQKLLRKARKGTRIIYLPGNHDEFLRGYFGTHVGGVDIQDTAIHETADDRRMLVIHGDQFDVVVRHAKWLAFFGDWAYSAALGLNTYFNMVRRAFGFSYWSLSAWAKLQVKNAVNFIGAFENALAGEAERRGVDGVICGHIHHARIHDHSGITYMNCGDWVESCTALAEDHDGTFLIIHWSDQSGRRDDLDDTSDFRQAAA